MKNFQKVSQGYPKKSPKYHAQINIALNKKIKKLQNKEHQDILEEANQTLSLLESIIKFEFRNSLVNNTQDSIKKMLLIYEQYNEENQDPILVLIIEDIKHRIKQMLRLDELLSINKKIDDKDRLTEGEQEKAEKAVALAHNLQSDIPLPDEFLFPLVFSFVKLSEIKLIINKNYEAISLLIEAINILENIPVEKRLVLKYTGLFGTSNANINQKEREKMVQSLLSKANFLLAKVYKQQEQENNIPSSNVENICYQLRKYQEAINNHNQALLITSNDPIIYHNRGEALFGLGKYQEAITDFSHAIELNNNYAFAYYNRGLIYAKLENHSKSIQDFNEAIRLDSNNQEAYYNRGKVYIQLGEDNEAIANFNRAIELNPNYALAYFNRGLIYHKLGNNREVQNPEDYEQAIADKSECYNRAITDYQQAVTLDETNWLAITKIGLIRYEIEDEEGAIQEWENALEINSEATEPKIALGVAHSCLGEQDESLEIARRVINKNKRWVDLEFVKEKMWGEHLLVNWIILVLNKCTFSETPTIRDH